MLLMIYGKSPMLERSEVASNGIGGTIPRALAEPGKCSRTIIGHDNEGMCPARESIV